MGILNDRYDKRKWKNWLLQPFIQVELGLYSMLISFTFCGVAFFILEKNIQNFYDIIVSLGGDQKDILTGLLDDYIFWTEILLGAILLLYFVVILAVTIIYTHKLVGPSVAFSQHIKRLIHGDYQQDVILRKGDAFHDVAQLLNDLTNQLRSQQERQKKE